MEEKEINKEELRQELLNAKFDFDEVVFKLKGFDFYLMYECARHFEEEIYGGDKYCITITRLKIQDEISGLFADTKEEAVEEVLSQLDLLLKIDNNEYINNQINNLEVEISKLKEKLEDENNKDYTK